MRRLEDTDDINTVTDYFSYEHFYVIYCKFWELDKDHDLLIDKLDMSKHGNGGEIILLSLIYHNNNFLHDKARAILVIF